MTSPGALDRFYSIIPAGGIGSRLWPLSRADAPKFLHDLTGSGQTLLRNTWDRLAPISGEQRIMVVTGRAHRAAVEAQLPALADANVVLESEPRDSTAAIGLAAAILQRREPGVIVGSFAADHVIRNHRLFASTVKEAVAAADAGYITTIGIKPTEPAVGFGYIHCGGELTVTGAPSALAVRSFVEKPDLKTAESYPAPPHASSGIVVSQTKRVISLIGVKDIVIVDTPDALLVTTTDNAQRVKSVVDALKVTGSTDVL
jgi:mannose-1-phosphate guanylyltransferase